MEIIDITKISIHPFLHLQGNLSRDFFLSFLSHIYSIHSHENHLFTFYIFYEEILWEQNWRLIAGRSDQKQSHISICRKHNVCNCYQYNDYSRMQSIHQFYICISMGFSLRFICQFCNGRLGHWAFKLL